MATTAQQILGDFIREVQLEKGHRVEISEIRAHTSNWAPVIGKTMSGKMIDRYAAAFLALRTRCPAIDWSGVETPGGQRVIGGDGIF